MEPRRPVKLNCKKCGQVFFRYGNAQRLCLDCKRIKKTEQEPKVLKSADGWVPCKRCSTPFYAGQSQRLFCEPCKKVNQREASSLSRANHVGPSRKWLATCEHCEREFPKKKPLGRPVYCSNECRRLAAYFHGIRYDRTRSAADDDAMIEQTLELIKQWVESHI